MNITETDPAYSNSGIVVYEWGGWSGFLLAVIEPGALRINARIGETHRDVLSRLPCGIGAFIFHVNLTDTGRLPQGRDALVHELLARGIVVLNWRPTNASKRVVQRTCLEAGLPVLAAQHQGDPEELLIVKTDLNYGGEPEMRLDLADRDHLGIKTPLTLTGGHLDYRVLRRRDLSPDIWDRQDVVVERYIDNRDHAVFRVHLLLSRTVVSRVVDRSVLKKMPARLRRQNWLVDSEGPSYAASGVPSNVLDSVTRYRLASGVDYGAIDLVQDDNDVCYVIDVNLTPSWGNTQDPEAVAFLAQAMRSSF